MSAPKAAAPSHLRVFLGAFGEPGHTFPMIALGERLAARGHAVTMETWSRWRPEVESAGMQFVAAPEYPVFPTRERPLGPYEAVTLATAATRRALESARPDVVVHDVLTLAPALAAELEGLPAATLIPHVYPPGPPAGGFPPYASGARLPRTAPGRVLWRRFDRAVARGLSRGRDELNETRTQVGLPPLDRVHGGISEQLCIVATFPQLEYPRAWPASTHVVGPIQWEPPFGEVEPPPGDAPLVLVAPSTAQDPDHRLLQAVLRGLAHEPVRVLASWNRRPLPQPVSVAANQRLVEWISYAQSMPACSLVICHAGHGTMVRALSCGVPVLAVPHAGDMNENAARLDWAGAGVRLPWPLLTPWSLREAVRFALSSPTLAARAAELAAWAAANPGATRAAELVEHLAADHLRHASSSPGWIRTTKN